MFDRTHTTLVPTLLEYTRCQSGSPMYHPTRCQKRSRGRQRANRVNIWEIELTDWNSSNLTCVHHYGLQRHSDSPRKFLPGRLCSSQCWLRILCLLRPHALRLCWGGVRFKLRCRYKAEVQTSVQPCEVRDETMSSNELSWCIAE